MDERQEFRPCGTPDQGGRLEVAAGFEPANNGFANRPLRPLGYATLMKGFEV
jgi:hypothetical protein